MKGTTAILLLLFGFYTSFATNKANVLRGESFVTVNTIPEEIEIIISQALTKKGFQILKDVLPNEEIFYVDLFVFQFPADYPTITITIRTTKGIHFIDKERIKIFGDRNSANLKLASRLAERLPDNIDTNIFFKPTFNDILSNNRISIIGLSSNAITKGYRSNYSTSIKWSDNTITDFIIPNEFDNYVAYISNYQGIRKQLRGTVIKLKLKINLGAKFELVDIVSPFDLTEKQKGMIQEFINSFPLWTIDKPIDNIELDFGIK
ncbi:MAG: hypothetical protein R2798_09410 [Chitinophagales bacterium]|nr:hypothetical protein [Bacteroidota bacterium]MCB9044455.1 hypothetical protein [Chitinophagales bacterium]